MSDPEDVPNSVEDLQAQIDHTRDELADTVEALAAKADVKGRAQAKVHEAAAQAQVKVHEAAAQAQVKAHEAQVRAGQAAHQAQEKARATAAQRPWLVPAAGGLIALVLGGWLAIRRRR